MHYVSTTLTDPIDHAMSPGITVFVGLAVTGPSSSSTHQLPVRISMAAVPARPRRAGPVNAPIPTSVLDHGDQRAAVPRLHRPALAAAAMRSPRAGRRVVAAQLPSALTAESGRACAPSRWPPARSYARPLGPPAPPLVPALAAGYSAAWVGRQLVGAPRRAVAPRVREPSPTVTRACGPAAARASVGGPPRPHQARRAPAQAGPRLARAHGHHRTARRRVSHATASHAAASHAAASHKSHAQPTMSRREAMVGAIMPSDG